MKAEVKVLKLKVKKPLKLKVKLKKKFNLWILTFVSKLP